MSPSVSMEYPYLGGMTVVEYSDLRIVAYMRAKPEGLPEGIFTAVIKRDSGDAHFYLTKQSGHITSGLFWYWTEDQLGQPDEGVCEKLLNRF